MELISVYASAGQLEAEMIKGFLEAQGLQVFLNQESVGRTMGLSAGTLGMVEVLVPDSQAADARELLQGIANGDFENTSLGDISKDQNSEDSERNSP